jgi:hypothetical protein
VPAYLTRGAVGPEDIERCVHELSNGLGMARRMAREHLIVLEEKG